MQRRNFIKHTSLCAFGVSVTGNIRFTDGHFEGLAPTTTDVLGPFYRPGAPMRNNVIPAGSKGEIMHLTGTVFKDDGKTPYQDCLVEIWQCSPEGIYDNTTDEYNFRGALSTGADGKYHFITTVPVAYPTDDAKKYYRPAHVHMRISGKQDQDLITQIYFTGDPYIKTDTYAKSPQAVNRILSINKNSKNENTLQFDVMMTKEFKLDDAVFEKVAGIYNMSDKSMVEFYKSGDLLFTKINGQIMEALYYKGNNSFNSAMDLVKVQFEIKEKGVVKTMVEYMDDTNKWIKSDGTKMLKYKS